MPRTFIGFNADEMFIGGKPPQEELTLSDFRAVLGSRNWHSRRSFKDETEARFLQEHTGVSLPFGSARMMYAVAGDIYIEVKVLNGQLRIFRYRALAAS